MANPEVKISDFKLIDILEYLKSIGCTIPPTMPVQISDFDINDILEYVRSLGCIVTVPTDED